MPGLTDHPCGPRPPRQGPAAPVVRLLATTLATLACCAALAQTGKPADQAAKPPAAAKPAAAPSALDAPLFYQLLIGELELKEGRPGNAYQVLLDAARRQSDDDLFQRAIDIALQSRAGDQALAAAKAWRDARPQSVAAMRYQVQILLALNRGDDLAEPMTAWLAAAPLMERPGLIASLPRVLQRLPDQQKALALASRLFTPLPGRARHPHRCPGGAGPGTPGCRPAGAGLGPGACRAGRRRQGRRARCCWHWTWCRPPPALKPWSPTTWPAPMPSPRCAWPMCAPWPRASAMPRPPASWNA